MSRIRSEEPPDVYRKCAEQIESFLKPRIEELDLASILATGGLGG